MLEAWEEFRAKTVLGSVWLTQDTVEAAEAFVPKDVLATAYNEFCDKVGRPGMNKKGFGRALKRSLPKIEDGQKSVAGKMTWCWLGIGLKAGGTDPTTHTTNRTNGKSPTCFENGKGSSKQEGGDSQITNKESSVSFVSSASEEVSPALTITDVLQDLEDSTTGAHKNALRYSAGDTALEYLVRSVLFARGIPTETWQHYAGLVEEAFKEWRRRGS